MGRLTALLLAGLFLLSGCAGERGTGTRGAFTQLTGVADHTGDRTAITSEITNSTAVMLATVAGNPYAVGYVSMGVLEGAGVKALPIDGAPPTPEAVADMTMGEIRDLLRALSGQSPDSGQNGRGEGHHGQEHDQEGARGTHAGQQGGAQGAGQGNGAQGGGNQGNGNGSQGAGGHRYGR